MGDTFPTDANEAGSAGSEIARKITLWYLSQLSEEKPADVISREILDATNDEIEALNIARHKKAQLPMVRELLPAQIALILLHVENVVRIAPPGGGAGPSSDVLGIYDPEEGIYVVDDDAFRRRARAYRFDLNKDQVREVMLALRDGAPRRERCSIRDLICLGNGVFNYRTKELQPHTPELVFTSKSRVDWNPNAHNPVIVNSQDGTSWDVESWMATLSDDPEVVELLWQILGAILRPHVRWNKSAWFYSERGNNGKGTLCELMRELLGPGNYASIPVAKFGKEFLLEPLTRASAIIVDENPVGTFVDDSADMKAVITNDVIQINRKHRDPIAVQFFGFMVQCLNELPLMKDKSESMSRRQLFVPFEKWFGGGAERRYIKDNYLHRTEVLEYVVRRVLLDMPDYYELSEPEKCRQLLEEYREHNDPVRAFWAEFGDPDKDWFTGWDMLPNQLLYDLFKCWHADQNPSGKPLSSRSFLSQLRTVVRSDPTWADATSREDAPRRIPQGPRTTFTNRAVSMYAYRLDGWFVSSSAGNNWFRPERCGDRYRGLVRFGSPAAALAPVDDEDAA